MSIVGWEAGDQLILPEFNTVFDVDYTPDPSGTKGVLTIWNFFNGVGLAMDIEVFGNFTFNDFSFTDQGTFTSISINGTPAAALLALSQPELDLLPLATDAVDSTLIATSEMDAFVFNPGLGKSVIQGFNASGEQHDILQFSASMFANWTALEAAIQDTPLGAVIEFGTDSITLLDINKALLVANHVDDFRFV